MYYLYCLSFESHWNQSQLKLDGVHSGLIGSLLQGWHIETNIQAHTYRQLTECPINLHVFRLRENPGEHTEQSEPGFKPVCVSANHYTSLYTPIHLLIVKKNGIWS